MNSNIKEQVKEILPTIFKKAATDIQFRRLCLENPRQAMKELTEMELPEDFNIRFIENKGADITLVLPDLKKKGDLSDDDLDQVTGGFTFMLV